MKILLTGATGFMGRELGIQLVKAGHQVVAITRSAARAKDQLPYPADVIEWDFQAVFPSTALNQVEAIIHLAGESVASGRWTDEQKKRIYDSRIGSTRALMDAVHIAKPKSLKTIVSASAVGIYGDRGDELLTEKSAPAITGFLADVCRDWEAALFDGDDSSIRKVALRIGVVLGRGGGALEKMLPIFRARAGGPIGDGQQWMSWIHQEDLVRLMLWAVENPQAEGALNAVAPTPVRNQDFSHALGAVIHRPSHLPAPKPAIKLALGEMATVVLASQRVIPERLESLGFKFKYADLVEALKAACPAATEESDEFLASQWVPYPIEKVFEFFASEKNLEKITPTWLDFNIKSVSTSPLQRGTLIDYKLKIHGFPVSWRTEINRWDPPRSFVDVQLQGPYKRWWHEHTFESLGKGTLIRDFVHYQLPLGMLGKAFAGGFVRGDVEKIFAFRRGRINEEFGSVK